MEQPIRPKHHIEITPEHIHAYQDYRCQATATPPRSFQAWFEEIYQAVPLVDHLGDTPRHRVDHRYQRWIRARYRQPRVCDDFLLIH